MAIDLHTHSVFSDGSETPAEVVRRAVKMGLDAVALTDHDILAGLGEAAATAHSLGIELVPGVELSVDWSDLEPDADQRGGMHLVVLWVDDEPGPLQDRLHELREARHTRNHTIIERLAQLGMDVPLADVLAKAGEGSVGRPHIAGVMLDRGYVPDIAAAFDQYLAHGRPAYVSRRRLQAAEAVRLSLDSGGVPILAHPHSLGFEHDAALEEMLRRLKTLGLQGLETHHSACEPDRRRLLAKMAARVGLARSGGSDFHGTYKPDVEVGVGVGDLSVPTTFLEALGRLRNRAR